MLLAILTPCCATVPGRRYSLDSIRFQGNDALPDDEIEEKIASRESSKFLGLFPGFIYEYEVFDRHVLERDLQRIERLYRARGYYRARVRAGRVTFHGKRGARVEIVIEEGPPVLLARVNVHGLDDVAAPIRERALAAAQAALPVDRPFEEQHFIDGGEAVRRALSDEGYAKAVVRRNARVNLPKSRASAGYFVERGERMQFGKVRLEGLGGVPEGPVRRALGIVAGEPYSEADLEAAQRALLDLGAFSSVTVEPELEKTTNHRVPILVKLVPTDFRSVRLGAGSELDTLHADVHGLIALEDRNFFGGLRHALLEIRPGVVLYPTRIPEIQAPQRLLPQGKVRLEFRQPGLIEKRTNLLLRGEANIYPILLSRVEPGAPILGNRDYRASAGVERSFGRFYGNPSQKVEVSQPFAYRGELDPDLAMVIASYPDLLAALDLRDDALEPHSGAYFRADLQFAGVGGDARNVRIEPEARFYVPLWRRLTLALRGTTGLLFPSNYGDTLVPNAFTKSSGGVSRAAWVRDIQLMFMRGFFSGGSGSNRGYGYREIGPHGTVPFYNPGQSSEALGADCLNGTGSQASCDLPLGGLTLWEASVELRYPILGPLLGVVFADASNVSPYRVSYRFNRPHLSVGLGLRYETPVGPIRLDAGYRVPDLQAPDSPDEGTPSDVFGMPGAISLGIGESF